jgi:hypothetical protein
VEAHGREAAMRKDVFVENDSGGLSLLSSAIVDRLIDDRRENDPQFVLDHQVVLGSLVGDDPYVARVIVGEPLSADEDEQWIAHYRWALEIPCGRLLLCGGFDPDVLSHWRDVGADASVREVAVPPGHYLVDAYTYLHTMNGRVLADDVWKEQLGAWFRRDHPDHPFPSWLAGELCLFSEQDPGHEREWNNVTASMAQGTLAIDIATRDWVSFVFHLQPFDATALGTPPEDGWFAPEEGLRRPARFPLGIPAQVRDPIHRQTLADIVGEDEAHDEISDAYEIIDDEVDD